MQSSESTSPITAHRSAGKTQQNETIGFEVAHIYGHQAFGPEQTLSCRLLTEHLSGVEAHLGPICVLVDDYNYPLGFSLLDLSQQLMDNGVHATHLVLESSMQGAADYLLNAMPDCRAKRRCQRYMKKQHRYPCSLLSAAWHLVRLGQFEDIQAECGLSGDIVPSTTRIVNILAEQYRDAEANTEEIILHSPWKHCMEQIDNLYFESPQSFNLKEDLYVLPLANSELDSLDDSINTPDVQRRLHYYGVSGNTREHLRLQLNRDLRKEDLSLTIYWQGRVAGFATMSDKIPEVPGWDAGLDYGIYIAPFARGNGIFQRVTTLLWEISNQLGVPLYACVAVDNSHSKHVHDKYWAGAKRSSITETMADSTQRKAVIMLLQEPPPVPIGDDITLAAKQITKQWKQESASPGSSSVF